MKSAKRLKPSRDVAAVARKLDPATRVAGRESPRRVGAGGVRRSLCLAALTLLAAPALAAAPPALPVPAAAPPAAQETVDQAMVARIRAEGLERSQVWETFGQLVDVFGPRLTASPAYNASAQWARDQLQSWGIDDARLEAFEFGRGWTLEGFRLEMLEPRYMPLMGYPRAWSPPTGGVLIAEPLWLAGKGPAELEAFRGRLAGAVVMTRPIETRFITEDRDYPPDDREAGAAASGERWSPTSRAAVAEEDSRDEAEREAERQAQQQARAAQQALARLIQEEGAGVALEPSRGVHGTIFVLGQSRDDDDAVPTVVLAAEHYNMIARMLERGAGVRLAVSVESRFHEDDTNGYNVIAEIPGVDPEIGDEVVMVGAHLDSWHSAPGATDNADGAATVLEAMRILKALGVQPRRTIRMALWAGEEQGLRGSRQYVARYLAGEANVAARDKFSVYFNLDPGAGPIKGFFLEGNQSVLPFFEANLAPFADLDTTILNMGGICCTDHLSFIREGLPGFQPIHSYDDYDVRTHHTNVDSYERIREQDLEQASVVMASLLYHAAMRDEMFPRAAPIGGR